MYKQFNNNPKNLKTSDCVIRAFSLALGKSWDEIFTDLCAMAMKEKSMPNDNKVYTKYAKQLGLAKCKIELVNGKKPTVRSFTESHKKGTYVLRVANHLVTVVDGDYYDIWDCGHKSVYMFWAKS